MNNPSPLLLVVETMKAKGYSSPDDFETKYVRSVASNNALNLKYDSLVNEYLLVKKDNDSLKSVLSIPVVSDAGIDGLMVELDEVKQKNIELEKENAVLTRRLKKLSDGSSKK